MISCWSWKDPDRNQNEEYLPVWSLPGGVMVMKTPDGEIRLALDYDPGGAFFVTLEKEYP